MHVRESIRAANEDLLQADEAGEGGPPPVSVLNADLNFLARKPTPISGCVLVAMPYLTVGGAEVLMTALVRELKKDVGRVIVTTSELLSAGMPDSGSIDREITDHFYELPLLFERTKPSSRPSCCPWSSATKWIPC